MGLFGRYDEDFDDGSMLSKREQTRKELQEKDEEETISQFVSLEKEIKKMKKFLKKENLYKKYKRKNK